MKRYLRRRSSSSPTALIAVCAIGASFMGAPVGVPTAVAGTPTEITEETQTIKLGGEGAIYVKNARGKTIIVGSPNADGVTIRARKFVRARDEETLVRWMEDLHFEVTSDGDRLAVITRYPKESETVKSLWAVLRGMKYRAYIEYTIEIPQELDTKVASASGDVEVSSIKGRAQVTGSSGNVLLRDIGRKVFVEMSSGDIEVYEAKGDASLILSSGDALVRGLGGSLNMRATSGDVEVYDVDGDVDVEMASGDFFVNGCKGDVIARTVSGDGTISSVSGNVRASAASGDLYLTLLPVGEKEFRIHTTSGDIQIAFHTPENYGFVLDVSTSHGTIEGDLDIQLDKVSRTMLRGLVGTGDARMMVETASGDISIRQK